MGDRCADRFGEAVDPLASMVRLVDVMLVFAWGLIAALGLDSGEPLQRHQQIADVPEGSNEGGSGEGFEPAGRVFRGPRTGKLFLLEGGR